MSISNDLVTVFIPVYNVKPYLERCINSVINQSYSNLEIIIIDDGSNDGCSDICDFYQRIDSRIIVKHQQNLGLPRTRQQAWNLAHGKYISYVDSDDYITLDMYEKVLYNGEGADIIQFGFIASGDTFDRWKDVESKRKFDSKKWYSKDEYLNLYLQRQIMPALWQRLFKRSLLTSSDYKSYYTSKDDHFNFPFIIWNSKSIKITNEQYYHWETRIGSLGHPNSVDFDQKSAEARFMSGVSIIDFFSKHGSELSDVLLQNMAKYLDSYLCQTAMHIASSPEMTLDWLLQCYYLIQKNIEAPLNYIRMIPIENSSIRIFELLENNDIGSLREYLCNDYQSKMQCFLNSFEFNG